jgi:hypothetical protein
MIHISIDTPPKKCKSHTRTEMHHKGCNQKWSAAVAHRNGSEIRERLFAPKGRLALPFWSGRRLPGLCVQNEPTVSARQAKGSHRVSAKASHKAHANMAALYHHSDTELVCYLVSA